MGFTVSAKAVGSSLVTWMAATPVESLGGGAVCGGDQGVEGGEVDRVGDVDDDAARELRTDKAGDAGHGSIGARHLTVVVGEARDALPRHGGARSVAGGGRVGCRRR